MMRVSIDSACSDSINIYTCTYMYMCTFTCRCWYLQIMMSSIFWRQTTCLASVSYVYVTIIVHYIVTGSSAASPTDMLYYHQQPSLLRFSNHGDHGTRPLNIVLLKCLGTFDNTLVEQYNVKVQVHDRQINQ